MIRDYVSDVNSDTDSDAELDYRTGEDASQTWRCHSAPTNIPLVDIPPVDIPPADIPLGLVQNPPTDITQTNMKNDEYPEKYVLIATYILR